MNSEAKQRAIMIGVSNTRAGGTALGRMRLRHSGVALGSAAKAGLRQMRAAAALVATIPQIAPVALRRITRSRRSGETMRLDQPAARVWRGRADRRVSPLSPKSGAAIAMTAAAPGRFKFLAGHGAARGRRIASAGLMMPYRFGATIVLPQAAGMAGATRPCAQPVPRSRHLGKPGWGRTRSYRIGALVAGRLRQLRVPAESSSGLRLVGADSAIARMVPAGQGRAALDAAAKRAPIAPIEAEPAASSRPRAGATGTPGGVTPVYGAQIGRWVTDYLTEAATRPPNGLSGLDDRLTPVFAGMVGFG